MTSRESLIRQSWEANAGAWTSAVRAGIIASRADATDRAILAAVEGAGVSHVLDVGCGEGWLCRALAKNGVRTVGFDGSAELVAQSIREDADGVYHHLTYEEFTADPLRVGGSFDAATINFSLFAREIGGVLEAIGKVLRPEGHLIVQTVHPHTIRQAERYEDGWRTEDFQSIGSDFRSPMPWYYRTVESWVREVIEAGFAIKALREPVYADSRRPASLLLIATRERAD